MKLYTLILAVGLLILTGCGLIGNRGVTKEQLNNDIANKVEGNATVAKHAPHLTSPSSDDYPELFQTW